MEQMAKLDSASEIPSPCEAVQLNLKGSCTANRSRGSTATSNMCTYNIGTEDDLDRLSDEVDHIKWDLIGLCETYRKRERLSEIKGGY